MGVISHDNIVYRDMPYKLAMHNTEGDTYFLYDELDNKSTMTPFFRMMMSFAMYSISLTTCVAIKTILLCEILEM